MAEWLRRSVSRLLGSTRVGSNPVVGTTNHKPTADSAVHPFEVGSEVLRGGSEGTTGDATSPRQLYRCRNTQPALTNKGTANSPTPCSPHSLISLSHGCSLDDNLCMFIVSFHRVAIYFHAPFGISLQIHAYCISVEFY